MAIQTCPECDGLGCIHCDHQGSWEGDWRCDTCDMVIDTLDNYCPSCEGVTTVYAGPQREWNELSATQMMKEMAA